LVQIIKIEVVKIINCSFGITLAINNQSLTNKLVSECISSWIVRTPKVSSGYWSAYRYLTDNQNV